VVHSGLPNEEDFQHHLSILAVFLELCGCWWWWQLSRTEYYHVTEVNITDIVYVKLNPRYQLIFN
jgi:hypothetical protein